MPSSELDVDASTLNESERERASRYHRPSDRIRYVMTRVLLRKLIGLRLGLKPAAIQFSVTQRGRLELAGNQGSLSFNVSHAGEHALIAISNVRTVGVDIEYIDPMLEWRQLLSVVCTENERRVLTMNEPEWIQRERFFKCWTAKEAVLKALGLGVAEDLCTLSVSPVACGAQQPIVAGAGPIAAARALQYYFLSDVSRYMGCVAYCESLLEQSRIR